MAESGRITEFEADPHLEIWPFKFEPDSLGVIIHTYAARPPYLCVVCSHNTLMNMCVST